MFPFSRVFEKKVARLLEYIHAILSLVLQDLTLYLDIIDTIPTLRIIKLPT